MQLLYRVLVEGVALPQQFSKRSGVQLPAYRYRFRQALLRFVSGPAPQEIPSGPLVLLVDGLWFQFGGVPWVLYLVAIKPSDGDYATFLDPVLLRGKESSLRWNTVLAAIPPQAMGRIRAIVGDDLPGMQMLAAQRRWVLQLCHFHLLLRLHAHHRGVRYALRGGAVREEIERLVRRAIQLPVDERLAKTLQRLNHLSQHDCVTIRFQTNLRTFLRELHYYRTYLTHPQLGLPHTTNAVESMGRLLREMFRSSRAGSNPNSIQLWATAYIRLRSQIRCNGR